MNYIEYRWNKSVQLMSTLDQQGRKRKYSKALLQTVADKPKSSTKNLRKIRKTTTKISIFLDFWTQFKNPRSALLEVAYLQALL